MLELDWKDTVSLVLALVFLVAVSVTLPFLLHTRIPLAAVTSGSMTPTIKQGDLLVIEGVNTSDLRVGNIIVYRSTDPYLSDELIVHRIIRVNQVDGKVVGYVTKGDNNLESDAVAGFEPPTGIPPNEVVGKVVLVIPLLGWVVLFLKQPIGLLVLVVLFGVVLFWGLSDKESKIAESKP